MKNDQMEVYEIVALKEYMEWLHHSPWNNSTMTDPRFVRYHILAAVNTIEKERREKRARL